MHEIRTNVERPYVSPQQLVAATETAAMDPRVQAVGFLSKYLNVSETAACPLLLQGHWQKPSQYMLATCGVSSLRRLEMRHSYWPIKREFPHRRESFDSRWLCIVQEFQAAKEQSSGSKHGLASMFSALDDPPEHELYDSTSLSLPAPWASQEVKIPIFTSWLKIDSLLSNVFAHAYSVAKLTCLTQNCVYPSAEFLDSKAWDERYS